MKVVVTGGSGHAGRHVVADLLEHGHEVTDADRAGPVPPGARYCQVNTEDLGQVFGCLTGMDAVVHMAALPRPVGYTNVEVFRTNVLSTFHVLEAATTLGIRRVVLASSVSVLGFPFFYRPLSPEYVPIDEHHPTLPQDPYALSKLLGEEIGKAFARRADMTILSLRFPWIHTPRTFAEQVRPLWDDPAAGATNLWSYIDARDVGQACRKALTADISGHEACFVAAPNSFMKIPTAELVRRFYPHARYLGEDRGGCPSLLNSARAEHLLGFHADYTWDTYGEEDA